MVTAIGVVVVIVGLIAWIGQTTAFLAPSLAVRLGVLEPKDEVDSTLYLIEAKAEGLADMLLTWTLPLSAFLMLLEHPLWPYLGLIGGGVFLYVAILITLSRIYRPSSERAAYVFGGIWALSAVIMIALSAIELSA
jgi:hypothetical protein